MALEAIDVGTFSSAVPRTREILVPSWPAIE
jgi:hypothetical protein